MTLRGTIAASLSACSLIGLGLIAAGIVPWGVRAVALFTLLGFVWLFLLLMIFSSEIYKRGL